MPTLEWIGKDKVINHHQEVPFRVLDRVYGFDAQGRHEAGVDSENAIIRGDNLEALKALLPRYEGRVDCIYIDPPYNTGNEGWVYNDNVNDPKIKKWLGEVVGKEDEDFSRHDKWLCMMYPRLKLLHKLLAETGAIFISIDDNECANLRLICDEIFGARNFLAQIVWQKRTSPDARRRLSTGHEYILAYFKNVEMAGDTINLLELDEEDRKKYSNPDNDPRGPWASTDFTAQGFRPNQVYSITTPSGKQYTPSAGHCWKNVEEKYLQLVAEGRIWFGKDGRGMPRRKTYLSERQGKNVWTWWTNKEVGDTQEATRELTAILGNKTIFDYPKPVRLIRRILQIATKKDSIVLDSFAGSGTTAHAVLNLNKADGGKRRFILVEMMDYAEQITAERVRRVIQGYGEGKQAVAGTGGGFTFYELGAPLLVEGLLNESVGVEKIRAYVWFMETHRPFVPPTEGNPYWLGTHNETDYYFYYEPERTTTLDYDFLAMLTRRAPAIIVYADRCILAKEQLMRLGIVFKKIPRDIRTL